MRSIGTSEHSQSKMREFHARRASNSRDLGPSILPAWMKISQRPPRYVKVAFWLADKVFEFVLLMLYQPDIAFDFTGGSPTLARTEIEELALHWTAQTLQRTISGGFTSGASGKESKRAKSSLFLGR